MEWKVEWKTIDTSKWNGNKVEWKWNGKCNGKNVRHRSGMETKWNKWNGKCNGKISHAICEMEKKWNGNWNGNGIENLCS